MTPFVLPLTLRTETGAVDLLFDLPEPVQLAAVLPAIRTAAALPPGTLLYCGPDLANGTWLLGTPPLLAGSVLSVVPEAPLFDGPVTLSCIAGPDAGGWVPIDDRPVLIGRDPGCDLVIADPELSRRHAQVTASTDGLVVSDLGSTNGVRVDGRPLSRSGSGPAVRPGALIRTGGSVLRSGLAAEPRMLLDPDGRGRLAVARPARVAPAFHSAVPDPVGAPPERTRHPVPLLTAAAGLLIGVAVALLTGLWNFLLLAAIGPLMMLISAVSDRLAGRVGHRRARSAHRRALEAERVLLVLAGEADRADAWDRYPDPATLARRARQPSVRLWERRPSDPDFLRLTVGIGSRPLRSIRPDPPTVTEVPITLDLLRIGVLGLTGDCRGVLRHLVAQLAALHSPADLALAIFSDQPDLTGLRDLPHAAGPDADPLRAPTAEVRPLLGGGNQDRLTVLVLDGAHRYRRVPGMTELLSIAARSAGAADGLGEQVGPTRPADRTRPSGTVLAICVAASAAALPVECTAVATVEAGAVRVAAGRTSIRAEPTGLSADRLDRLARRLAGLLDPDLARAGLPDRLTLAQLVGPRSIAAAVRQAWADPALVAPIGHSRDGPVRVDLERDGPHLLIAGTTGSGKSELLQTLITGLACAAPPDRTVFLLIDYKGGAAFGALASLPHTCGLVTDLDEALAARALIGLRAELRRREQLLADHGVADLAQLRAAGHRLPSLVIVVDEFATLGSALPQFLAGLLDVAQRGRSLGVHLVLATQRPSGVLSPAIKANISLRICLRVTDDADSLDVIDSPEAARISATTVGRAWLRSERSRLTLFQVAQVSAVSPTGPTVRRRAGPSDPTPTFGGLGHPPPDGPTDPPTDLDLAISAVVSAFGAGQRPEALWRDPLPLDYRPTESTAFALLDEPERQRQTVLPAPESSVLVLGTGGSGRSAALRRLAWCAATAGATLAVVDPAGGLADLAGWASTSTYLDAHDPALVRRLLQLVQQLRSDRRAAALAVVVDGWETVSALLDPLDFGAGTDALVDLAGAGPAAGIRLLASGGLRLQHHRVGSAVGLLVRLGADERGEPLPGPPGRGRCGGHELQCAHHPPDGPDPVGGRPGTPTRRGPVVRALPTRISATDLPAPTAEAVPLGLGGDAATVVGLDLTGPGGGLLLAGPRRSGVSSTLTLLACGAAAAGVRVVRPFLRRPAALPDLEDIDLRDGTEVLQALLVRHEGPILLALDDADDYDSRHAQGLDTAAQRAALLLERFVTVAGPGQYLAVGVRLDRAVHARSGLIPEVAAFRSGVLLHADSADGTVLDAVIPRLRGPVLPGRGHLVREGVAIPLQVAAR